MPRLIALLALLLGFFLHLSVQAQTTDPGQEGPAKFYYEQYENEPWRNPESPKNLLFKSGELLAGLALLSGWIHIKKRRMT